MSGDADSPDASVIAKHGGAEADKQLAYIDWLAD
jgi:hypothetical protein